MFRRLFERYRLAIREARFIRVSLLLAVGINLLNWALALWFVLPRLATNPFFALHYTVYFGVDRIGAPWGLLQLPLIGLLLLLLDSALAAWLYAKDRLASAFLTALALLLTGLLLFLTFLTILLNL